MLHIGHLYHFREAKSYGDILIVSVTRDLFVNKGPGRPVFDEIKRLAMIRELRIVNTAGLVSSSIEALQHYRPDIYAKGEEYAGNLPEEDYCRSSGIKVVFTKARKYSSTQLLHFYDRPEHS